jgi:protease YdgD
MVKSLALAVALIAMAVTLAAEADERARIAPPGYPFDAVGRVERGGDGYCTGVLVAADRVVTAAHCLWDRELGRLVPPARLHFVAGFRRGDYRGHAKVRAVRVDPELRFDARGRPSRLDLDYVELTLERAVAGVTPLELAPPRSAGRELVRVGYGRSRPYLPTSTGPCLPIEASSSARLLVHDCPAQDGDSGGPLLVQDGTGWRVAAIQVANVNEAGRAVGIAVPLARQLPATALR